MRQVALYIRVSTDAQYEEGYSVDAQKEKLEQFCKLRDIDNYAFYIDGGWSGSNIDRPEMKRMIADILAGRVSSVVVYKLDRLSRSQKDTIYLLEDIFIPNSCNFVSLNENFDTTTPYGKAMIGILSVFAQLERENIRERTRMGMYERVKSGLWMGGGRTPYGYDYDSSLDILVPNEKADNVRKMYELYLAGYSAGEIAGMFDVANDRHVFNILDRPTYKGCILYRGELLKGQHEAIVSDELWDSVQVERKRRSTKRGAVKEYLLTGLLYCGICGAKMRYQKWGKHIRIYCYSQQTSRPELIHDPNCNNARYYAQDVENAVLKSVFEYTDSIKLSEDAGRVAISAVETLQERHNSIAVKIKRLYNLYATSGDEILLETIKDNQKELQEVDKLLEAETAAQNIVSEMSRQLQMIRNLHTGWDGMSEHEQRQSLRACIDRVVLTQENIEVKFRF